MFIFSGKSRCCNCTFTAVFFYVAANKEQKDKLFSDKYVQHSLSYIVWNFHSNQSIFLSVIQETLDEDCRQAEEPKRLVDS